MQLIAEEEEIRGFNRENTSSKVNYSSTSTTNDWI